MTTPNTWALPLLKRRLLAGERVTQADVLKATDGRAWRLSAAVHYLRGCGWQIITSIDATGCAVYWLPQSERERLRAEGVAA